MGGASEPAFVLRLVPYGESDLVVTLLSREQGVFPAMAKAARKSQKRFGGALELFSRVNAVAGRGRNAGMRLLQESTAVRSHEGIRRDVVKTAMASSWAEVTCLRVEDGQGGELFDLFDFALAALDEEQAGSLNAHLFFLVRFLAAMGFLPRFTSCVACGRPLDDEGVLRFFPARGGVACDSCGVAGGMALHPGTAKQLAWAARGDLATARRVRFSGEAAQEGQRLLERFLAFHLEVEPKSLQFLRDIQRA
ncbi:MAG: DNA repair protein RecO [Proteobacteria bacterium]|nr:DNA repair protein RecO [Pseudomonadota bacterium]